MRTANDLTGEYLEIVSEIASLEAKVSELRKRRQELDGLVAQWMDSQGVETLKGDGISLSRKAKRVYKVDDWDAMMEWAHQKGIFPFHRRVADAVLGEIEESGERLPDCVMPQEVHQINYRSL